MSISSVLTISYESNPACFILIDTVFDCVINLVIFHGLYQATLRDILFGMRKFLKIIIVLLLLSLLVPIIWYENHKGFFAEKVKTYLETKTSEVFNRSVKIGSFKHKLLCSFILENIDLYDPDTQLKAGSIRAITITPEIFTLLIKHKLVAKITIKGLHAEHLTGDASLRIIFRKTGSWKETFDLARVENIKIVKGKLKWKEYKFKNISGDLKLHDSGISQGKLFFTCNSLKLALNFMKVPGRTADYRVILKSENFLLDGILLSGKNMLLVHRFRGTLFSVGMNLKGIIKNLNSDHNMTFELIGFISGDIKNLVTLIPNNEKLKNILNSSGWIRTGITVSVNESNPSGLTLIAGARSKSLNFNKIEVKDLSVNFSIKDKRIDMPRMDFYLFDSPTSVNFAMDMNDADLPMTFSIKTTDMKLDTALGGVIDQKKESFGPLDLEISFKGYGHDLADLPCIAQNKPFEFVDIIKQWNTIFTDKDRLQNMELNGAVKLKNLRLTTTRFDDIVSRFSLMNGKLIISPLTFGAFGGKFHGSAKVDLADEKLPFTLYTEINRMDSGTVFKNMLGPKNKIAGPFDLSLSSGGYGKTITEAVKNLKQTTGKRPLTPFDTVREVFILLVNENRIRDIDLETAMRLKDLCLEKTELENLSAKLSMNSGRLNISYLDFNSFGGKFHGSAEVNLASKRFPFSLNARIAQMDSGALFKNMLGQKNKIDGPFDFDLSLSGYGRKIADVFQNIERKHGRAPLTPLEKVWEGFILLANENRIQDIGLDAAMNFKNLELDKTKISNCSAKLSLKTGKLNVPYLDFNSFGGKFHGSGGINLADKRFPFSLNTQIEQMDSGSLFENMLGPKNKVTGPFNFSLSANGYGKTISDTVKSLKQKPHETPLTPLDIVRGSCAKLVNENHVQDINLNAAMNLKNLALDKTELGNCSTKFSVNAGKLNVSYLDFDSYGGKFHGEAEMNLASKRFPFSLNARIEQMDSGSLFKNMLGPKNKIKGPFKLDLAYSGYGKTLADLAEHLRKKNGIRTLTTPEKIHSTILFLSEEKEIKDQLLRADFSLKTIQVNKTGFDDIYGKTSLSDGRFAATLNGLFYNGRFSSSFFCDLDKKTFPFILNSEILDTDFGLLIKSTGDKNSPVFGKMNFDMHLQGSSIDQKSYTGSGKI
ncbi:MAG: AsmA family protein, partial [Candidatus Omnitrophica bacterium]|nr:AsmA family protein [Candidatus Omnitrophota bacterium]